MKRMIWLMAAVAAVAAFMAAASVQAADPKFGVVDVQKVLNQSDAGKDAKDQLAGRVKKYQEEINLKQDELKKLKEEIEKQGVLLSESARANKERDYQQKLKEFQRFTKDAQEELQGKDEEFTRKIVEEIEKTVQDYGRKNGYVFIFVRNETMIYSDEKADVTEAVLKALNAQRKK
jgi:outer membrane protein